METQIKSGIPETRDNPEGVIVRRSKRISMLIYRGRERIAQRGKKKPAGKPNEDKKRRSCMVEITAAMGVQQCEIFERPAGTRRFGGSLAQEKTIRGGDDTVGRDNFERGCAGEKREKRQEREKDIEATKRLKALKNGGDSEKESFSTI